MRYILILMLGILCFTMTSCPAPEEADNEPAISDADHKKPDFDGEDKEAAEEPAAACEKCGEEECTCEAGEEDPGMLFGPEPGEDGEAAEAECCGEGGECCKEAAEAECCGEGGECCKEAEEEHGEDDGHGH